MYRGALARSAAAVKHGKDSGMDWPPRADRIASAVVMLVMPSLGAAAMFAAALVLVLK